MLALLGVAAALLASAPAPSAALTVRGGEGKGAPGAHVRSLAGEAFDLGMPGEHVLLRMPREPAKPALIRVAGDFLASEYAPCVVYLNNLSIRGEWLGSRILNMGLFNGSLSIKVSSTSPTYAGPWRSVESFEDEPGGGLEELPGTARVSTLLPLSASRKYKSVWSKASASRAMEPPWFHVQFGPQEAKRRSLLSVSQGLREGLDVSLSNMRAFDSAMLAGLLGPEKHEELVEQRTAECEAHAERVSKHPKAPRIFSSWSLQPTYLQNLAGEEFVMNKPGDFDLLRAPKLKAQPALIRARGAFASADDASCVVYLSNVTLSGEWLGGKVVHLRSWSGSFAIKISSEKPPAAGTWRAIDAFVAGIRGPEALPETVEVAAALSEGPVFKFHLGNDRTQPRPSISVTQALHGGLEVSLSGMDRMAVPEMSGLLGTDRHDTKLDVRSADCEAALQRFREPPAGSSLTASWGL